MADENTAAEAAEETQVQEAPVVEEQQVEEAPEPIANLAKELGWVPRDEFRGDPEAWKPAEQFIRDGREIQQTTSRELRGLREQMERIGGVTETIVQDKVAQARAEWERSLTQAVEDGDTATALKLAREEPQAKPNSTGPDPQVAEWVGKNAWYNADPLAQARAVELSNRLAHLPVPEQLKQVERAIRKEFPEHFPKAKDPPATQTGGSRNPNPSNRAKGFADIPQASQAVFHDMAKRHPDLTKEAFAKSYWQDQERVSR